MRKYQVVLQQLYNTRYNATFVWSHCALKLLAMFWFNVVCFFYSSSLCICNIYSIVYVSFCQHRFSLIVAFSPTGWTFGKGKKKSPGRRWQQGTIIRYYPIISCSWKEVLFRSNTTYKPWSSLLSLVEKVSS